MLYLNRIIHEITTSSAWAGIGGGVTGGLHTSELQTGGGVSTADDGV